MPDAADPLTPDLRARFPLIDAAGARLLRRLEEHPQAPRFTHPGVDRLTPAGLQRAAEFAPLAAGASPWTQTTRPPWLAGFVERCYRTVPIYRRRGLAPARFDDVPATTRADLGREPWAFVPDDQALDGLVVYNTSGTTGHPLSILTHADTLALYLPLLRAAVGWHGLTLPAGPGRVAIALVAWQHRTYTYAAVSAVLDQAGFVKVNLHPDDWRDPTDRARFLDDCAPAVITGDPLALAELARLPLTARPLAVVSTAMALAPGLRAAWSAHWGCPVLDVYSLNESGPVAVLAGPGYRLLQPELYVEVLDEAGQPCPPGGRGEIALTGGFNPCLPLLRYRTNDYARLEFDEIGPYLADLQGRAPVLFFGGDGRRVNNIDVAIALRDLPLAWYTLHQAADGVLTLRAASGSPTSEMWERLAALFGPKTGLRIELSDAPDGKRRQFTSDLSEAGGA